MQVPHAAETFLDTSQHHNIPTSRHVLRETITNVMNMFQSSSNSSSRSRSRHAPGEVDNGTAKFGIGQDVVVQAGPLRKKGLLGTWKQNTVVMYENEISTIALETIQIYNIKRVQFSNGDDKFSVYLKNSRNGSSDVFTFRAAATTADAQQGVSVWVEKLMHVMYVCQQDLKWTFVSELVFLNACHPQKLEAVHLPTQTKPVNLSTSACSSGQFAQFTKVWKWQDDFGCWRYLDQAAESLILGNSISAVEKTIPVIVSGQRYNLLTMSKAMVNTNTGRLHLLEDNSNILKAKQAADIVSIERERFKVAMDQYHEIIKTYTSRGQREVECGNFFIDPSFLPTSKSLYINGKCASNGAGWDCAKCTFHNENCSIDTCSLCGTPRATATKWQRPISTPHSKSQGPWRLFASDPKPKDIIQGALGNCWFLSSLAVLAERPELLQSVILEHSIQVGVYLVRLFKDGMWEYVLVDDFLPCTSMNQLVYSQSSRYQLWVPIIEKAVAKLYGSYEAIAAGQVYDGLSLLTGEPVAKIHTCARGGVDEPDVNDEDLMWIKLLSYREAGYLMGASCGIFEEDGSGFEEVGLQKFHAYSLLDVVCNDSNRLICLRNPWGTDQWNGDWSASSALWTDVVKSQLRHSTSGNGVFWMCFSDFRKYFGRIDVCKIRPEWRKARYTGSFLTGGEMQCCRKGDVKCYYIHQVAESTEVEIVLQQKGERGISGQPSAPMDIGICVCKINRDTRSSEMYLYVSSTRRVTSSFVTLEVFLEAKETYVVIPLGFNKFSIEETLLKVPPTYTLTIHSFKDLHTEERNVPLNYVIPKAMALRSRHEGKEKEIFDRMFIITQMHDAGTVIIAENRHPSKSFTVELNSSESFNLNSTRGSLHTYDRIPPLHWQIIQIFSQVQDSGYAWSSHIQYECDRQRDLVEIHKPIISTKGLHGPCRYLPY